MKKKTIFVFATAAQLLAVSPSFATTYDLSATFAGIEGEPTATVTGTITVDGGSLTGFDLTLPTLIDPAYSTITDSPPSYVTISTLPSTQIESIYDDGGTFYSTILNLDLASLPTDSTATSLGFSSLEQALYAVGGNWDYLGFLQSSSITLENPPSATPLPAALPLFAGGLGLLLFFGKHRKRRTALA
jgi:hypothetical protein